MADDMHGSIGRYVSCSLVQRSKAIANKKHSTRAKEAVEKLTGDKVTAKREFQASYAIVKEMC